MAEEILAVDGTAAPNDWAAAGVGPPTKVDAVALPDDGDTTYLVSTTPVSQRMTLADPVVITANDVIQALRIRAVARRPDGIGDPGIFQLQAILGADALVAGQFVTTTTYGEFIANFPTRPDMGAWTLADLQSVQVQIDNVNGTVRLTSFDARVDYTPAASVTPDGAFSGPVACLRELLSQCTAVQDWLGAANAAEALASIYMFEKTGPTRPLFLVTIDPGWRYQASEQGSSGVELFEPAGTLVIRFEDNVDPDHSESEQAIAFLNRISDVLEQLVEQARTTVFQIIGIAARGVPQESDPKEQNSAGHFYRHEILVHWAGRWCD